LYASEAYPGGANKANSDGLTGKHATAFAAILGFGQRANGWQTAQASDGWSRPPCLLSTVQSA